MSEAFLFVGCAGTLIFECASASMAGTMGPELPLRWLRIPRTFEAFEARTTECENSSPRAPGIVALLPPTPPGNLEEAQYQNYVTLRERCRKWYDTPSHVAKPRLVLG